MTPAQPMSSLPRTPLADARDVAPGGARVVSIRELRARCASCSMRELCLPVGLEPAELAQLDAAVASRRRLRKGETLYRAGESFAALHAIRVGSLKTVVLAEDGRSQVAGYHMLGDIIGLDGIERGVHGCEAVALEDAEVCMLPFEKLEELARDVPALQRNLHRFIAAEISRDHGVMLLLGSMRAEERVAAFLLSLSERYRRRGYSSAEFVLRMTREEIGSYLGLKLETVSRLFSRLQEAGIIRVDGRKITLLDVEALKQVASGK